MSAANGYSSITALTSPMDRRYQTIEHQDWGKYLIQSLDSLERTSYESRIQMGQITQDRKVLQRSLSDVKEQLIVLMLVDPESKKKLLTPDHVPILQKQDSAKIDWLFTECSNFAGFSESDVEELVKN